SRAAGHQRAQRSACAVLGTGEVGREAPRELDLGPPGVPPHRDGRRPRRPVRALRRVEGRGDRSVVRLRRAGSRVVRLRAADGVGLEAEWAPAVEPHATAVLCHPHPQYGGTMRSIVISALFEALPPRGISCLRFNFRGVEGSDGESTAGRDEPLDVLAALDAATGRAESAGPLVLIGWSFGADMALTIDDLRIAGWAAIAPPLRFRAASEYETVGKDARPKLVILGAHDEFRAPIEIEDETRHWTATRVEVVAGASHFFIGRAARVVTVAGAFVDDLAARV